MNAVKEALVEDICDTGRRFGAELGQEALVDAFRRLNEEDARRQPLSYETAGDEKGAQKSVVELLALPKDELIKLLRVANFPAQL